MATAEEYAQWIVNNADKKGTPAFNTVAQAYQEAKAQESLGAGQYESVLPSNEPSTASKIGQSLLKGAAGAIHIAAGLPENIKRGYQWVTTEGMPAPRLAAPLTTYLTQKNAGEVPCIMGDLIIPA